MYTYVYIHLFNFELKYMYYDNPQCQSFWFCFCFFFLTSFWEEWSLVIISCQDPFVFSGASAFYMLKRSLICQKLCKLFVCHWHSTFVHDMGLFFASVLIKHPVSNCLYTIILCLGLQSPQLPWDLYNFLLSHDL